MHEDMPVRLRADSWMSVVDNWAGVMLEEVGGRGV
jgi:hypothetical protein